MTQLAVHETQIPGLLVVDLPVHGDDRGWFKENWQRQKMVAAGLPDFGPVQNNISFNQAVGVTRGIHAEPWDKYISVATGRVFGAWVDLRAGDSFGTTYWHEITPEVAIFVPRGVGNAFQTLEAPAAYTYLVSDHWSEAAQSQYTFLNLADETAAIPWPIPLEQAELSAKDLAHPRLAEVTPVPPRRTLVIGGGGQLGRALAARWTYRADVDVVTRELLDLADPASVEAFDFSGYGTIINAAAYTAVDAAESDEGRRAAWAVNVTGVGRLVEAAREQRATLVHISSDYVFDGTTEVHDEDGRRARWASTGRRKPLAISSSASLSRALHRTHQLGDRRGRHLRGHHGESRRARHRPVGGRRPDRPAHLHRRSRRRDRPPAHRATCCRASTTSRTRANRSAGLASPPRVFALTGHERDRVTPMSTQDYYAGETRDRPATSALRPGSREDPRHRLRPPRAVRGAGGAPRRVTGAWLNRAPG